MAFPAVTAATLAALFFGVIFWCFMTPLAAIVGAFLVGQLVFGVLIFEHCVLCQSIRKARTRTITFFQR